MRLLENGEEWRLSGLLYADDLVLCSELEEDLREIVGRFAGVCTRRGVKVNTGNNKVMVLNVEEGLVCEVPVDETRLEHVYEFKYLRCVLDESGTDGAERSRKVLGICSLSVLESCMKHWLYIFLCMAMRECYGRRRRDLELGLYR